MIDFENPVAFFLLLLIPLYYFLRRMKLFSSISFALTLSNWNGTSFTWKQNGRKFLHVLIVVTSLLGFVCGIIGAANPVIHHQEKVYVSKGADILFVVDTSPSMASMDMAGQNRLEASKQAIHSLVKENNGAAIGLVEMASESAIVVPPTLDHETFFNRLDKLAIGEMGEGTAIGSGLSCAAFHLSKSTSSSKSIVLITDGENNSGAIHPYTAAHLVKEKNVMLYILGIGKAGSAPFEYADPKTGDVHYGDIYSNYDTKVMAALASEAGGEFFAIESIPALSQALGSIARHEAVVQTYHMRNHDQPLYAYFLYAAAILLAAAWFTKRVLLQEMI